jgi:hypothetical protein
LAVPPGKLEMGHAFGARVRVGTFHTTLFCTQNTYQTARVRSSPLTLS